MIFFLKLKKKFGGNVIFFTFATYLIENEFTYIINKINQWKHLRKISVQYRHQVAMGLLYSVQFLEAEIIMILASGYGFHNFEFLKEIKNPMQT